MPNPFPGVNPYIEMGDDLWVGFRNALVTCIGLQLNPILNPRGYAVYIEKRVDLAYEEADEKNARGPTLKFSVEPAGPTRHPRPRRCSMFCRPR
jgi:hypothetical protein